ncbi:DUF5946 family protein [Flagellimonas sp. HMM57]|uniref:DUF5946 family protein n=1 Tax=unclassified Flagellimonas TaxID=2644544 RepID=UPI0013D3F821|nr:MULTISPECIES: DUF5946 family protein [unclassified Flagellimonas]UII77618.1 DUF5946 family protein [Flagellimonas sp. HMM57]
MQDYSSFAQKNGITLKSKGHCQFCGAKTTRGVHECVEVFNLGFPIIDYSKKENHFYRFLAVDAHTLQHSEIHGRWNNHFHLTRQHLIFEYGVIWDYNLSALLSDCLKMYKVEKPNEILITPSLLRRGKSTVLDVINDSVDEISCKKSIKTWGKDVYQAWNTYHQIIDVIAERFMDKNKDLHRNGGL